MKLKANPVERVGSLHIKPNWRHELLHNPAKYKMQEFVSVPETNTGSLKRYLASGLSFEVNYQMPLYLRDYLVELDDECKDEFQRLWRRSFKQNGQQRLDIESSLKLFQKTPIWNLKLVPEIKDE